MQEIICQGCGAVFTSDAEGIPAGLICSCQNKDFKLNVPSLE